MVRIIGIFKANFYTAKRYKIDWAGSLLYPLFNILPAVLLIFYSGSTGISSFLGLPTTNIETYIKYLMIGTVYWGYVEVLWSTIFMLRSYMKSGQFEDIFLSPIKCIENILGWAVLGIIRTTVESLPLIILVIIISYKSLTLMNIAIALGILLMSIIASFGMTFFIFGLTLIIKEGDQLASFIGNSAPFLGGLYFPIMLLPSPLRYISFIFPFTWGVDILRGTLLNINTIFSIKHEFIILVILSIGYLIIGKVAYYMLEKKARNVGVHDF